MFYNRVILIGRVVADPEPARVTPSGVRVTTFRIAVDRVPRTTPEGEKVKETDFFRITAFGKLADFVELHLTQGRLILVEGELRANRWRDQLGSPRVIYEIRANNIRFLDRKPQPPSEHEIPPEEEEIEIDEEDLGLDDTPPEF